MSQFPCIEPHLHISTAINPHFLLVEPHGSVAQVLALMRQTRSSCQLQDNDRPDAPEFCSCALVMDRQKLLGLFTEREAIGLIAQGGALDHLPVMQFLKPVTVTLYPQPDHDMFTALAILNQHHLRYLPVVDAQGYPQGVITRSDIRRNLSPANLLTRLRRVQDVMSDPIIAPPETSLTQLAQKMTHHQVSCVVICTPQAKDPWQPLGLISERDLLQLHSLELDFHQTTAGEVMSGPVVTIHPDDSLWQAHQCMSERNIRRLVVVDQGHLVGLISQSSFLHVLNPAAMYSLIDSLQDRLDERNRQLEERNQQLQKEVEERRRAEQILEATYIQVKQLAAQRTEQLERTTKQWVQDQQVRHEVEEALRSSEEKLRLQHSELEETLQDLHRMQLQLIQTEKMSSLGQLVAGIAHEINNPINFIYGNLAYAENYMNDLMTLVGLYETYYPQPPQEIEAYNEAIELDFMRGDLVKLMGSMQQGAERIRHLVLSLRNFSRLDESHLKTVDIHDGMESTLLILHHKLKAHDLDESIKVMRDWGDLPGVECYPGQLNQVFFNVLSNTIDVLAATDFASKTIPDRHRLTATKLLHNLEYWHRPCILLGTKDLRNGWIQITIADNGHGMGEEVRHHLFEPFFTTKAVGKGTGLGLSLSYQIIVEKHRGQIHCWSEPGVGTEFVLTIPARQEGATP